MARGLGYRRSDLFRDRLGFRTTVRGTPQAAWMADLQVYLPQLVTKRGFLDTYIRYEYSPQMDYFGEGPKTSLEDRTSYRLEDFLPWVRGGWEFYRFLRVGGTAGGDLLARSVAELPTRMPPDRPLGAAPEELYEAAQEFLTDWLVREKFDEAMGFFSRRVIACINIDEGRQAALLDVEEAVVAMREIMSYALQELPDRDNLTEAIDEVLPQDQDMADRVVSHPFERDFTIVQVRNRVAADYTCSTRRGGDPPPMPGGADALGTYYGVLFRFKARDDQGGVLGLLWDKQEGPWQIVSYDVIQY